MKDLTHYIEAFSSLHTAKIKGQKAPHKAVLLLSIIDLIEEGVISSPQIELTDHLDRKFKAEWQRYIGESPIFKADITKPFFHMQYEDFWELVESKEAKLSMAAEPPLLLVSPKTMKSLPPGSYSIQAMRKAFEYAKINTELFELLHSTHARAALRVALIKTLP